MLADGARSLGDAQNRDAAPSRQDVLQAMTAMDRESYCYIRRRIPHVPDAEDVMHDFYLRVFEHAGSLRDRGSTRSWLYHVLRSALMEHLRAKRRQFDVVNRLGSRAAEPAADVSYPDRAFLKDILGQLKPEYSDILIRLQVRADTPWEAAADLGTTPNNVRVRHFRARAALRDAYAKCSTGPGGTVRRVPA
jgi:RNA polymerase sigma-70 factor (ECF subfamily)